MSSLLRLFLALACGGTLVTPVHAQIFQTPPCPQYISPGVLGYDGLIDKDGVLFPVSSLYHTTPGSSDVVYHTIPERPQSGTKVWELAGVGATCYWWMGPLGAWLVVQETTKYGYVHDLLACRGGSGGTPVTLVADDPYDPDYSPYSSSGNCNGSSGTGGSLVCHQEWIVIEMSIDGGITWEPYWSGYATVCE
jgi:hypothetical protein